MANELIINASLPEIRIALMESGEIQDLVIERASGKGIAGNIYKGRVTRVLPGMQAAFVDIGLEKAAFLYVDDVYVHSEIWEEEEGRNEKVSVTEEIQGIRVSSAEGAAPGTTNVASQDSQSAQDSETILPPPFDSEGSGERVESGHLDHQAVPEDHVKVAGHHDLQGHAKGHHEVHNTADDHDEDSHDDHDDHDEDNNDEDDNDDDHKIEEMGEDPDGGSGDNASKAEHIPGTISPPEISAQETSQGHSEQVADAQSQDSAAEAPAHQEKDGGRGGRNFKRGRRLSSGRFGRKRERPKHNQELKSDQRPESRSESGPDSRSESRPESGYDQGQKLENYPETYREQVADKGGTESDRSGIDDHAEDLVPSGAERPQVPSQVEGERRPDLGAGPAASRGEFRAQRGRDRRIRPRSSMRPVRGQVNIQDLLKEGQEVVVQVAKDPIAAKGARLTCHISLPGRHLVCMPTIDHVGVSRRIDRDDERRKLREYVERYRPKNLGFIVRTASGRQQSEKRIKQDIEYLARLWNEIREKANEVTAPALVYEDLNSVLRAIRDWVTEDIDKIIVDSRYHYNEIQRFVSHFMPALRQKVDLYHGDIPIFDAYNISTELSRALERKVWLKSGGYIVIDQAEALVAIDVNTGRYVGKKNLEDTILKTNLEAVQEIAYQLRLRNCGGIIILDLIDMEKEENKQRVYRALDEALKKDRARPTILKISELGLVEMTRKRTRDTIIRALCESCPSCEGKGFTKSKQTVAYEVMREIERAGIDRGITKVLVQAHPDVIDILAVDEREVLDQLERRYRKQIYLQSVVDFNAEQFEVMTEKQAAQERDRERDSKQEHQKEHHSKDRDQQRFRGRDRNRQDRDRHDRTDRNGSSGGRMAHGPSSSPSAPRVVIPRDPDAAPSYPVAQQMAPSNVGDVSTNTVKVDASTENTQGVGNVAGEANQASSSGSNVVIGSGPSGSENRSEIKPASHGFDSDEDRLAFMRAQAAQDAALARLSHSGGSSSGALKRDAGGRDQGAARRGRRGGRRNGKFQNNRDVDRGGGRFHRPRAWTATGDASKPVNGDHEVAERTSEPTSTPVPILPPPITGERSSGGGGNDDSTPV